jgi:Flp pilus assembly protein TadG
MRKQLRRLSRLATDLQQHGQSVVIVAFAFVGILAVVGLAVDVGFVYARRAQLSSAVDAAALAGVVELTRAQNEQQNALDRAAEFLNANDIPESAIRYTLDNGLFAFDADPDSTTIGARTFALTVTQEVELFFLRVIGRHSVNLTESATAANFPLADLYASRRVETGALSTSNQAVFGPHSCVDQGDPFSSELDSRAENFRARWLGNATQRTYRYRILIPETYEQNVCAVTGEDPASSHCDVVRVELFDPDSVNKSGNTDTVVHTQIAIEEGEPPTEELSCGSQAHKNPCLIETGEGNLGYDLDQINLWWFRRIDENRGAGTPPGNGSCGEPSYDVRYNTITRYTLYYFLRSTGGSIQRADLATYYGQAGDFVESRNGSWRDLHYSNFNHQTDLRWVSPGGEPSYDQPVAVPTYCFGSSSPNGGCGGPGDEPGPGNGFEVDISEDLSNIVVDEGTGARYIYMEVETVSGASENGFEVWAGPRLYVNSSSSDVNARNVQITNDPSSHSSYGVTVFGLGHLPMNSNFGNPVDIPLIYVGPEYAGTSVFVSNFDSDAGARPPVTFYFDTISEDDWSLTFSRSGHDDPDGVEAGERCIIGSCATQWIDPPYEIRIPTLSDDCTNPNDPDQREICTPFYGGRLIARYEGGQHDTYHWNISLSGLPYLIK